MKVLRQGAPGSSEDGCEMSGRGWMEAARKKTPGFGKNFITVMYFLI